MIASFPTVCSEPEALVLSKSEVHVWTVFLDSWKKSFAFFLERLDEEEVVRAAQFRSETKRQRFVIRRFLLKKLLSLYLGIPCKEIHFNYGQHGKPYLSNDSAIRFNTSHSQGLALYIISLQRQVGIDLETIQPVPEIDALLSRWFPSYQTTPLDKLSSQDKLLAFYQLWTTREAYLKALGRGVIGLQDTVDTFSTHTKSAHHHLFGESSGPDPWSFQVLTPATNFVATLAVASFDYRLRCFEWKADTEPYSNATLSQPEEIRHG
jgi:4'-phosphopantetheinyl transferase